MTYNVFGGTLSLTQSINRLLDKVGVQYLVKYANVIRTVHIRTHSSACLAELWRMEVQRNLL